MTQTTAAIKVNAFGDVIISGEPQSVSIALQGYDCEKECIILKLTRPENTPSFSPVAEKNGWHLYANAVALARCPRPVKNELSVTQVIVQLVDEEGKSSILMIHNRKSPHGFACPGGMRDPEDEDQMACGAREVYEETGLAVEKASLKPVGEYACYCNAYDEKWRVVNFIYACRIEMTRKAIEGLLDSFVVNDEIDQLVAVPVDNLIREDVTVLTRMHHHVFAIKRVLGMNRDEKAKFDYLENYRIYE